jgi:hypothetical protein
MGDLRETVSISLYPNHRKVLEVWTNETGMGVSELVRFLIEEHSDCRFKRSGIFGWELKGPSFQEEQEE